MRCKACNKEMEQGESLWRPEKNCFEDLCWACRGKVDFIDDKNNLVPTVEYREYVLHSTTENTLVGSAYKYVDIDK